MLDPVETPVELESEGVVLFSDGLASPPAAVELSADGAGFSASLATAGAEVPPFLKSVAYQPVPFS